jgi:ribonuclease HII
MSNDSSRWILGIDEAGRGPLAGPVSVGIVVLPKNFDIKIFGKLRDSKKLSEKRRIEIFDLIKDLSKSGKLKYSVALVSNKIIDEKGISYSIRKGIEGVLEKLNLGDSFVKIFLDGSLKAPIQYEQETIIKGDEKIPVISLASIVAKVTRDEYMKKKSADFKNYGFEIHKGYGTKKHIDKIKEFGLSNLHRKTFCKSII